MVKFSLSKWDNHYFADFETTSLKNFMIENEVRVFMYRIEDIYGNGMQGLTIDEFFTDLKRISKGRTVYVWFHNLGFDFSFIESAFLRNEIAEFKLDFPWYFRKTTWGGEYTVTRDEMGNTYGAEWYVGRGSVVNFRDTSKIFPMTLDSLGKMVGVKKLKDNFDYDKFREKDYQPTDDEWKYIQNDTAIMRVAMIDVFKKYGKVRMTRSSYAFADLKEEFERTHAPKDWKKQRIKLYGKRSRKTYFSHCFPETPPSVYDKLRPAYAGGIVYVNPEYRAKEVGPTLAVDVNSEYPAAMSEYPIIDENGHIKMIEREFPIFEEKEFDGYYENLPDDVKKEYPLYVQFFTCKFKLKSNGFPMLPKKYGKKRKTIYSSDDLREFQVMALCNTDFEHFLRNYDVDVDSFVFYGGYMWQSIKAPFKSYIERKSKEKIDAELRGDMMGRQAAKLDMNSCYGKFAQNPRKGTKGAYLDEEEVVRHTIEYIDEGEEGVNYLPMAIFITAYARDILLRGIYAVGVERVMYVDTDSMHIIGWDVPIELPIHETKIGFWAPDGGELLKDENGELVKTIVNGKEQFITTGRFTNAKFLRDKFYAKTYIKPDGTEGIVVKGAGISDEAKAKVKYLDEFMLGTYFEGNLQSRKVRGGTLLVNVEKFVKPDEDNMTDDERVRYEKYLSELHIRKDEERERYQQEVDKLREELLKEGKI